MAHVLRWCCRQDQRCHHPGPSRCVGVHGPRTSWRGGRDHPLELPAVSHLVEARSGPGGGQHHRSEAFLADERHRPGVGGLGGRSGLPRRGRERHHRERCRRRRGAGRASGREQDHHHGRLPYGSGSDACVCEQPQAGHVRVWREASPHRVRGRGPRSGSGRGGGLGVSLDWPIMCARVAALRPARGL